MFRKKTKRATDEEIDRIGRSVLRVASASDDEADKASLSPYLFTRIAARIEEEQRRRDESVNGWLMALTQARRAIAALALVAIVAITALWISANRSQRESPSAISGNVNLRPASVSACSLASADECVITNDDVLATMFAEGEGGPKR